MPAHGPPDPVFGQLRVFPVDLDAADTPDGAGYNYVLSVRAEALALPRVFSANRALVPENQINTPKQAQTHTQSQLQTPPERALQRPEKRPRLHSTANALSYDEENPAFFHLRAVTGRILQTGISSTASDFKTFYETMHTIAASLLPATDLPSSRAEWKQHMSANLPTATDHATSLILLNYLSKWLSQRQSLRLAEWTWFLVLRLPTILSGDEIAILRDVFRAIRAGESASAASDKETDTGDSGGSSIAQSETLAALEAFKFVVVNQYGQRDLDLENHNVYFKGG